MERNSAGTTSLAALSTLIEQISSFPGNGSPARLRRGKRRIPKRVHLRRWPRRTSSVRPADYSGKPKYAAISNYRYKFYYSAECSVFEFYYLQDVTSAVGSRVEGDRGGNVFRTSSQGCSLALTGGRWESGVPPAAATDTAVGGSTWANLGAGDVVEGGEREGRAKHRGLPR